MADTLQPYTGARLRTQHFKNLEVVSVFDFGATADGITNDAGAFNAAILALAPTGGTVVVPAGRYKISGTISMKSNVTVRCDAGAVLDGTGDTGNFISFIGTVGAEFLFNTSPTRGGTTVGITGGAFAVGDIVHLVSYNSVFAPGEYNLGFHGSDACWFTEWNIVAQVISAGVYRLAAPFEFPGWTSGVAKAKKVTPITNAHWIGGTIIRPTSGADSILESDWAYQCSVRDRRSTTARKPAAA